MSPHGFGGVQIRRAEEYPCRRTIARSDAAAQGVSVAKPVGDDRGTSVIMQGCGPGGAEGPPDFAAGSLRHAGHAAAGEPHFWVEGLPTYYW